jgi:DNA mismatch repair protein MSH6
MDKNKRFCDHPDFDETSLFIPEDELDKLPKTLRQYWSIKKENMEKIVAFKVEIVKKIIFHRLTDFLN